MLTINRVCSTCGNLFSSGVRAIEADDYEFHEISEECCADCLGKQYAENINLAELLEAENGYTEM